MNGERLSEAGAERRAAMLADLQRQVAARGRRRVAARTGFGAAAALLVVAGGVVAIREMTARVGVAERGPRVVHGAGPVEETPVLPEREAAPAVVAEAPRELGVVPRVNPGAVAMVRTVQADGSMVRRERGVVAVQMVEASDESLAEGLRAAGVGAGVARVGERVMVVRDREEGEG